jgi:hypothetical protein
MTMRTMTVRTVQTFLATCALTLITFGSTSAQGTG